MQIKQYIKSGKSVTLIMSDNSPLPIPQENPMFGKICSMLEAHDFNGAAELADLAKRIVLHSKGKFYVDAGVVYVGSDPLPDALSTRVIQFADAGIDYEPLINFFNNIKLNPSYESVKDLYAFLEANEVPITADGCFVGYKRVGEDYFDLQTHKYDNHVGKKPSMKREEVDPDRTHTCSRGLHVAAYKYAKDFYGNGHLMEVKVNPKDVVTVPPDYSQQKMRVCEYEVVRECDGPRKEVLYTEDNSYQDFIDEDDNYNEDFDIEQEDANSNQAVDTKTGSMIYPDSRGRICIPAWVCRGANFKAGQTVYVMVDTVGGIVVSDIYRTNYKSYTVDKHLNIRVGRYLTNPYTVKSVGDGYIELV